MREDRHIQTVGHARVFDGGVVGDELGVAAGREVYVVEGLVVQGVGERERYRCRAAGAVIADVGGAGYYRAGGAASYIVADGASGRCRGGCGGSWAAAYLLVDD